MNERTVRTPRAAVFLDKDGTLIDDLPYNVDPALIRLAPGVAEGIPLLNEAGYALIVVSNQAGVARGYFPEQALAGVEGRLRALLRGLGADLSGFYYCPHHPDGVVERYSIACSCRKPRPGMLLRAAEELNIDLSRSWVIGDILNDIEAGRSAGCRTILIDGGHETEWRLTPDRTPHFLAGDFAEAARIIRAVDEPPFSAAPSIADTRRSI